MINYSQQVDENEEKQSLCLRRTAFFDDFKTELEAIYQAYVLALTPTDGPHQNPLSVSWQNEAIDSSRQDFSKFTTEMEEIEFQNRKEKRRLEDEDESLHLAWRKALEEESHH